MEYISFVMHLHQLRWRYLFLCLRLQDSTIIGGEEARGFIKEKFKYIILGSAIAFGAMALGKEIAAWFM